MIRNYEIGAMVTIDDECIKTMWNSNGSSTNPGYPSESYIEKAETVKNKSGIVTDKFPGYSITVHFVYTAEYNEIKEVIFHMKDNWVKPLDNKFEIVL